MNPKIEIRYDDSTCHGGFGVFAKEFIPASKLVGLYYGDVYSRTINPEKNKNDYIYGFNLENVIVC